MRVTAEMKTATRRRILEVAQKLFAAQGFDATTTRDIARGAEIATGTLFNYFSTKEAIVASLVCEAHAAEASRFGKPRVEAEPRTCEEELFAFVAAILRRLKPFRKDLPAVMETVLSPLSRARDDEASSLRVDHLETVVAIVTRHRRREAPSTMALQLYWTLFTGVLAFWSNDSSPRQEDTLALLDQSIAMFVAWLTGQGNQDSQPPTER